MVVYPSLVFKETSLVLAYPDVCLLNYWRMAVCLSSRHDGLPIPPVGGIVMAYVRRDDPQAIPGRHPMRCFYISCLGPEGYIDGIDWCGKGQNIVLPSSVVPRVAHCQPPVDFRRHPGDQHALIQNRIKGLLADHRRMWERDSADHGFVLPDHREQWDGNAIPF